MSKAYQFPVKTARGSKEKPQTGYRKEAKPKETAAPFGSRMERWCYEALLQLGWKAEDIKIQTPYFGGRNFPGGQVVDIILYKPITCAISLKGEYWHEDEGEELFNDARLMGQFEEYYVIWWREADTYAKMYQCVLERVGRP